MSEILSVSGVNLHLLGDKQAHDAFALSHCLSRISAAVSKSALAERISFVAGVSTAREIFAACTEIREAHRRAVIIIDAYESVSGKHTRESIIDSLEKEGFQFLTIDGAISLLGSTTQYLYPYAKAEVSASVVAISNDLQQVLLVKRAAEPFKGMYALPGGFLRPLVETMEQCACRELSEETGLQLNPELLRLVTVRSELGRDKRGQVIDHSYLATVPSFAGLDLRPSDDASVIGLFPIDEALNLALAADHSKILFEAVRKYVKETSLLKRFVSQASQLIRTCKSSSPIIVEA